MLEERVREDCASPEECRENVRKKIAQEIRWLKSYQKTQARVETARMELEATRHRVPSTSLLRAEAFLERCFANTLNQLNDLQRKRMG